jgi:parvulin-like peptidyl-prolyl isomerase
VARRIPLPRLTQRQRMARWQRERRQQTIILVVFTVLLLSALGLVAYAATNRYYTENLKPAATIDGHALAYRTYTHERDYELVKFYQDSGVPKGFENDPQLARQKQEYDGIALNSLVEQAVLDAQSRADGFAFSADDISARYRQEFGQFRTRHILIKLEANTKKDPADVEADAKEKADGIAKQLRAAPNDQDLWNKLAKENSEDTGSKDKGGEVGWNSKGQLVPEYENAVKALAIGQISDPIKSQFGFHVIQLEERRGPENNDLIARWLSSGFKLDEILLHTRYDMLREHYTEVAQSQSVQSPTEQIHLLRIVVSVPAPNSAAAQDFTAALKKLGDVRAALDSGTDFADVAKRYSEDSDQAKKGGDAGWFARGMLDSASKEQELFALAPGTVSRQFSTTEQVEIYKVAEKDPAKALTDEQKTSLKDNAYSYWFDKTRRAHQVQKLVPGFEFQP